MVPGDFCWRDVARYGARLSGRKHLVTGNHDGDGVRDWLGWASVQPYRELKLAGRRVVLFHYPIAEWNGFSGVRSICTVMSMVAGPRRPRHAMWGWTAGITHPCHGRRSRASWPVSQQPEKRAGNARPASYGAGAQRLRMDMGPIRAMRMEHPVRGWGGIHVRAGPDLTPSRCGPCPRKRGMGGFSNVIGC
ncbi:hypothetical protein RAA17_17565 [Komagataeibacter rhaeticus]|nr:hypothetical protein [Komagataeibacter rhaeticus]